MLRCCWRSLPHAARRDPQAPLEGCRPRSPYSRGDANPRGNQGRRARLQDTVDRALAPRHHLARDSRRGGAPASHPAGPGSTPGGPALGRPRSGLLPPGRDATESTATVKDARGAVPALWARSAVSRFCDTATSAICSPLASIRRWRATGPGMLAYRSHSTSTATSFRA